MGDRCGEQTQWMSLDEASSSMDVLVDIEGNRPCAAEMMTIHGRRFIRLLFQRPIYMKTSYALILGLDRKIVPIYVAP